MRYYYDGMQEYVDGISEAIADGMTLAEDAKSVYIQIATAVKAYLKSQGFCKEYAEAFIQDKLGVSEIDFDDAKSDCEDFWLVVEADVVDSISELIPRLANNILNSAIHNNTACTEPARVDIGIATAGKGCVVISSIVIAVSYTTICNLQVLKADKTTEEILIIDTL